MCSTCLAEYEQAFGKDYAKPKGFARVISWLYHLIPKIGPFRALAFKVPTPEAEKLFLESFERTKERYAQSLSAVKSGRPDFANINLDLGRAAPKGGYQLADDTYDELIKKLSDRKHAAVSAALRADLVKHYGAADPRVTALQP